MSPLRNKLLGTCLTTVKKKDISLQRKLFTFKLGTTGAIFLLCGVLDNFCKLMHKLEIWQNLFQLQKVGIKISHKISNSIIVMLMKWQGWSCKANWFGFPGVLSLNSNPFLSCLVLGISWLYYLPFLFLV